MKKILFALMISTTCFVFPIFAKSYSEYLADAKKYENQKKWCYALGAYYDAMGTDELTENKKEAFDGYTALRDTIIAGNPGLGKFNQFTIHDEWKALLIDAEKYGSNNNMYEIRIGKLTQSELDYKTKTATYTANISFKKGNRYTNTIDIIKTGYIKAYKEDWKDLPEKWPLYSVSSKQNNIYNVDGALIYARDALDPYSWKESTSYINAFAMLESKKNWKKQTSGLYDYKFNIVNEDGKELVKGKRWLLDESRIISFSGISPDVMDLIDNGKAFVNPVACYLEYGKYNNADDKGGRTFIKNFPEVQLPLENNMFITEKNQQNKITNNIALTKINFMKNFNMIEINDMKIAMLKTEVTQDLYEAVMGCNPSIHKSPDNPVENISWDDAINFCNKLSMLKNLTPVYVYENESDISCSITQNPKANGFRLPFEDEWKNAAQGADSETDSIDDCVWYGDNSNDKPHTVATKKPNIYGLFDMLGNVNEWTSKNLSVIDRHLAIRFYAFGGCYYSDRKDFEEGSVVKKADWNLNFHSAYYGSTGFRIVRNLSE